jgi:hypothetical protein
MKRILIAASMGLLLVFSAYGQDYAELIKENPAMAGANMMNYHYETTSYTPTPKGYKAFYISHYGRHGSRYDTGDVNAMYVWPIMRKAAEAGLLTDVGMAFYKDLNAVLSEQDGKYGMLTSLGAREHREIAERMAENFPQVFGKRSGRKHVLCQSSLSPRCLISMTNFSQSLDRNTQGLDFEFIAGNKFQEVIAFVPKPESAKKMAREKEEDVRKATMKPLDIIEYFFNDTKKALDLIKDPFVFEQRLYLASCVGHLSDNGACLLAHWPHDILVRNFEVRNPRFYLSYGMSDEMSDYQQQISRKLLADFVNRADEALKEGSNMAADLRFGHDTALLPLVGHIRIEGMENWAAFDQVNSVWNSSMSICMGSNLQMIFYRNKSGEVLVKMLYNEKETTIPALKTFSGPYYKWSDLRQYFAGLL